jgi:hypothetical protein
LLLTLAGLIASSLPGQAQVFPIPENHVPVSSPATSGQDGLSPYPGVRIETESNEGISFVVSVDSLRQSHSPIRPDYSIVTYDRAISASKPGDPDLPFTRVIVGIPTGGSPTGDSPAQGTVSVAAAGAQEMTDNNVQVAPALTYRGDSPIWEFSSVYDQATFYPQELVRIERIADVRDVRSAFLLIAPVQYNPQTHELRWYRQVRVQVKFSEPASPTARPAGPAPWSRIYPEIMLNGSTAAAWAAPHETLAVRNFFDRSEVWYRIKIESAGPYQITYDDLKRAGVKPDQIDARTIQIFTVGDHNPSAPPDSMFEVPCAIAGKNDSVLGKAGAIIFYGQAGSRWTDRFSQFFRNLYTRYNYYWLTWGAAPGQRMAVSSSPPAGAPVAEGSIRRRREEDLQCPARSGLLWVWQELTKSEFQDSLSADFNLQLELPNALDEMTIRLYSIDANPDLYRGHVWNHLHIYLNGALLDSVTFGVQRPGSPLDLTYHADSLNLPLNPDTNVLRLALVGDSLRTVFLDYVDIRYRHALSMKSGMTEFMLEGSDPLEALVKDVGRNPVVLDVTTPMAPVLVTDFVHQGDSLRFGFPGPDPTIYCAAERTRLHRPLALVRRTPGRLKGSLAHSDYLIVCPDSLSDVAQLLQRYRTNNLPGIPNAQVMTAKLTEIYDEFGFGLEEPGAIKAFLKIKRPVYCLLVGDATYDYRDNLGLHPAPGVPPVEFGEDLDPNVYSSNAYAIDAWYADLEGGGDSPDIIMGRITCRTPQEFRRYYDKVKAYEQGRFGFWNRRFILLADDEYLGDPGKPDYLATQHIPPCERMGGLWGNRLDLVKVYLTEYPFTAPRDKAGAREELLRQLANGALLWVFFGHGAGFQLCHERALSIDDVPAVHNGRRLPLAYFGSCGVGRWEDTKNECIAEELARKEDGAIATVGATKGTSPPSNESFCNQMLTVLLGRDSSTLGQAYYAAWVRGDKLYHLFGEPGMRLKLPAGDTLAITVPDSLKAGRPIQFRATLPLVRGSYAATGFTDQRLRTYHSPYLQISYLLAGHEFFRGIGQVVNGQVNGSALVPNQVQGARNVADGSYAPLPRTSRISILGWGPNDCWSAVRDSLYFDTTSVVSSDSVGPEITILADGKRLYPGEFVPRSFELSAQIQDSSGVLIAPVDRYDMSLYYYVNNPAQRISVADKFSYDFDSHTTGRFSSSVTLSDPQDTIYVVATDNYLNRSSASIGIQTRVDELVRILNPLIYPNPVSGPAHFTFQLNQAAQVTIQIYTLSGRPVRTMTSQDCNLGYNQISWDGCDRAGAALPNGVYLYRLEASASEQTPGSRRESVHQLFDKFIIRR